MNICVLTWLHTICFINYQVEVQITLSYINLITAQREKPINNAKIKGVCPIYKHLNPRKGHLLALFLSDIQNWALGTAFLIESRTDGHSDEKIAFSINFVEIALLTQASMKLVNLYVFHITYFHHNQDVSPKQGSETH